MQRKTCTGIKLATLLTVIAACQDNTVAPDPVMQEQRLTAEEAADIAEQAVDVIDWVLDGETDANPLLVPADRSSDLALTMSRVPVTRKFSWTREHECWGGGTFHARGAGTKTGDRDTGSEREPEVHQSVDQTRADARVKDPGHGKPVSDIAGRHREFS